MLKACCGDLVVAGCAWVVSEMGHVSVACLVGIISTRDRIRIFGRWVF